MKTKLFFIWWVCVGVAFASELTPEENLAQVEGLEKWSKIADLADKLPTKDAIATLSEGILKTSRRSIYSIDGTDVVARKLRNALLAIPGHAEYFEKQIKDLQFKLESAPKDEKGPYSVDYDNAQIGAFQTLEQLPSPETVRVLGDFLADKRGGLDFSEVGPNPTEGQIMAQQKKNCNYAALALSKLIDHPPTEDAGWLKPGAVKAWSDWYEQVKTGKRTFRFKGDPVDYDLNGPAPKEKLERNERALKRDEEREIGHRKSTAAPEAAPAPTAAVAPMSRSIAGILAAFALIGGAIWYFLRSRRTV